MKHSKRYREVKVKIQPKKYLLNEAIALVKSSANAKYNESVDISIKLGVDPKKSDQMVRGVSNLPHGTGKEKRILVLTKGEKEKEATEAGADYVGFDEWIEKIKKGWSAIDVVIATPDVMSEVGKLGRLLGPKGLMPSPKSGTVTFDVAKQVKAQKKGKIEFKLDKSGCIHSSVGRVSFDEKMLRENIITFLQSIIAAKPVSLKKQYIKSITISSTIGPGIRTDEKEVLKEITKGGL
jgi:large subunit ribosomal protein L1